MMRLALLFLAVLLTGCASTHALSVACLSCDLLQSSGVCGGSGSALGRRPRPACPKGERYVIANFAAWIDGKEEPRIECRRVK